MYCWIEALVDAIWFLHETIQFTIKLIVWYSEIAALSSKWQNRSKVMVGMQCACPLTSAGHQICKRYSHSPSKTVWSSLIFSLLIGQPGAVSYKFSSRLLLLSARPKINMFLVSEHHQEDAMDCSRWRKQIGMIDDHDECEWVNVSSGTGLPGLSWTKSTEP